ncbi:MAG TPA: hypothetical protein VM784_01540 [Actinomycetota bacterium]|nr:hypothetical protein [Actinomycetota bacterium]
MADRRIIGIVAVFLVLSTGAAAFAAFRPGAAPPPTGPEAVVPMGGGAKADFINKADALCARATTRIKALTFPTTQLEAVAYVTAGIAITRNLLEDLRALDAPKQDRRELRKVLRGFDRSVGAAESYLAAIRSGNPVTTAQAERRVARVTIRANGWARAYGFGACAEGA